MIGGIDIQIRSHAGEDTLEFAVRAIRQGWPRAVFANATTGERYEEFWQIPFSEVEELFVYQDRDTADRWEDEGAVPALYNTMIHLIPDPGLLTVVIDERNTEVTEFVEAISSGVSSDLFVLGTELEAV